MARNDLPVQIAKPLNSSAQLLILILSELLMWSAAAHTLRVAMTQIGVLVC
jgi:hypothetical protein